MTLAFEQPGPVERDWSDAISPIEDIIEDARNGRMFIGGNNKSKLPDGLPDFEPWVVAMEASGRLMWWQRLYAER